jgi:hypothetical protein
MIPDSVVGMIKMVIMAGVVVVIVLNPDLVLKTIDAVIGALTGVLKLGK